MVSVEEKKKTKVERKYELLAKFLNSKPILCKASVHRKCVTIHSALPLKLISPRISIFAQLLSMNEVLAI